jgi:hypothetical protein
LSWCFQRRMLPGNGGLFLVCALLFLAKLAKLSSPVF